MAITKTDLECAVEQLRKATGNGGYAVHYNADGAQLVHLYDRACQSVSPRGTRTQTHAWITAYVTGWMCGRRATRLELESSWSAADAALTAQLERGLKEYTQ